MIASAPILELREVDIAYGKVRVLHAVSMQIYTGEVVALLGANGAGKTTTLRAISGLLTPTKGDILYNGTSIVRWRPDLIVQSGIAHSPEERHVWPELSVLENLSLGAYTCGDRAERARRLGAVLERFPRLRERTAQLAGTLSGGEQQMLAIGRALMASPKVLLLDEPSLGLSPRMVKEVLDVVQQLRDRGITILLVEQNVHNAFSVAERAYVFESGRVVVQDKAQSLQNNSELLRAYMGR
jgi:branched-chain amino acid transport system ATP-binding protein